MEILQQTSAFAVFVALAIAGLLLLVGGMVFGGAHDIGHEFIHDFGHGGGHSGDGHDQPVSIFSIKVIATFIMIFGVAGGIAVHLGQSTLVASLVGVFSGAVVGFLALQALRRLYSYHSEPEASSVSLKGKVGTVTTAISPGEIGEVDVLVGVAPRSYLARSNLPQGIARGSRVKIVEVVGTELVVEAV